MFFQSMPGHNAAIPRPLILGLLMLLLFLSTQMEWTAGGAKPGSRQSIHLQGGVPSASEVREGVKEKIILDLSLSNERLERENTRLKQHMLDLRRAARACGCDLNATDADAAAAYPELAKLLGMAGASAAGTGGDDEVQIPHRALAPVPEAAILHTPERHRQHFPLGQDPRRHRSRSYRRLLLAEQTGKHLPEGGRQMRWS